MNIILHLGGNPLRASKAAELALRYPDATVVISSEGGDHGLSYYDAAGIDRNRIVIDMQAWDTVTNFTHTYKLLKSLGCSRLFVVTDFFHCYRSSLIALACWGGRVPFYMVPYSDSVLESDEALGWADFARTLCWRFFSLVFFSKTVREQRMPGYKLSNEHGREIGI
jgi:uncharacterized SAM-binding protein YcdF (DUF218 family)